jgi:hypothetical protein
LLFQRDIDAVLFLFEGQNEFSEGCVVTSLVADFEIGDFPAVSSATRRVESNRSVVEIGNVQFEFFGRHCESGAARGCFVFEK